MSTKLTWRALDEMDEAKTASSGSTLDSVSLHLRFVPTGLLLLKNVFILEIPAYTPSINTSINEVMHITMSDVTCRKCAFAALWKSRVFPTLQWQDLFVTLG
jgi:hypothetical protein